MSLSKIEQETIILFNEADDVAEIEAYSAKLRRRLDQLCTDRPDDIKLVRRNSDYSAVYEFPKNWIKINPSRKLTAEQIEAAKERARANFH